MTGSVYVPYKRKKCSSDFLKKNEKRNNGKLKLTKSRKKCSYATFSECSLVPWSLFMLTAKITKLRY